MWLFVCVCLCLFVCVYVCLYVCLLACLLAGWLAGWLVGWLVGLSLLAWLVRCSFFGLLACFFDLLVGFVRLSIV